MSATSLQEKARRSRPCPAVWLHMLELLERIARTGAWEGHVHTSAIAFILANLEKYEHARSVFYAHDPKTVDIFDWRTAYGILCSLFPKEKFPFALENAPYTPERWAGLEARARALDIPREKNDYLLDIIDTWLLESYALHGICEAQPGDIVLDCGAYTGNTALYFAQKVGETGRVHAFEAGKGQVLQQAQNRLRGCANVFLHNCAVAGHSGTVRFDGGDSYGSHICEQGGTEVACVSIDDFVQRAKPERVDFIKMDIEGAEAQALKGARRAIRAWRPRMAISAYHKPGDMAELPALIWSIEPHYNFYLRHYSNVEWETVLFCEPAEHPVLPEYETAWQQEKEQYSGFFNGMGLLASVLAVPTNMDAIAALYARTNQLKDEFEKMQKKHTDALRRLEETLRRNIALQKAVQSISRKLEPGT